MYSIVDTLELIFLGGLFGAMGQAVREILSLGEARSSAAFKMSRLLTNLSIGFVVGCLTISILAKSAAYQFSRQDVFTLLVLGFAVGEIVEGIKLLVSKGSNREHT